MKSAATYARILAVLLLAGGLLFNQQFVESALVPDMHLGSDLKRGLLLGLQLSAVGIAVFLVRRGHWPNGLLAFGLIAALLLGYTWMTRDLTARSRTLWERPSAGEIVYVADSHNFVHGPFGREALSVEILDFELEEPWDLEFLPDGSMLVTETPGSIRWLREDEARVVHRLKPLAEYESGLLGLAIDPAFSDNAFVYVYYTVDLDESDPAYAELDRWVRRAVNRISRFVLRGGALRDERIILDSIPGSPMHSGGRLEFGPDGKLYATTGDAHSPLLALDLSFLGGKVLRLNPDGTIPSDNPIPGTYVYSRGHRNPQGLAWDPRTGSLYESEHGTDRYDEINRVAPGGNYGWGAISCDVVTPEGATLAEGDPATADARQPAVCFKRFTMAPSGMTFVDDTASPWHGDLFVAGLRGAHLRRYRTTGDGIDAGEVFFISDAAEEETGISRRLRDVEYHAGALYVIGDEFGLARITP